jgi:type VI secretion system protein VasL
MTTHPERHLRTGGDPRTLAGYALLRDELSKLTHPARPDVNWREAERHCLSLFEHNGIELQTAAWYTLVRTHLAGLTGLNEGLTLLEALITRQWGELWPPQAHARIEILGTLSKRLQQHMRTRTLVYADLGALYQAEKHLSVTSEALQRLELKHQAGLDALRQQLHAAAVRLENSGGEAGQPAVLPVRSSQEQRSCEDPGEENPARWIYVVPTVPGSLIRAEHERSAWHWKSFTAGLFTMLLAGGVLQWGIHWLTHNPARDALMASVAPLPALLSDDTLKTLQKTETDNRQAWFGQARQRLEQLSALSPAWPMDYGNRLIHQAQTLWPDSPETAALTHQWQQQLAATSAPADSLDGWQQGMDKLQQLTRRLNGLDEQKGKYMTVSELKSQVFAITQALNRTVPVEEQLHQLATLPADSTESAALRAQTELHLKQLLARYVSADTPQGKQNTAQ